MVAKPIRLFEGSLPLDSCELFCQCQAGSATHHQLQLLQLDFTALFQNPSYTSSSSAPQYTMNKLGLHTRMAEEVEGSEGSQNWVQALCC